jgi:hypothetical protein
MVLAGALAAAVQNPQSSADADRLTVALEDNTVAAYVEILVDPQGNMTKCSVYKVWGRKDAAAKLCAMEGAPGWKPAIGVDGKPAWGVVREVLQFTAERPVHDEARRMAQTPEIEIMVNALPAARKQLDLKVNLQVAADGRPEACEAQQPAADLRAFAALACKEAMKASVNVPTALNAAFVIGYRVRIFAGGAG